MSKMAYSASNGFLVQWKNIEAFVNGIFFSLGIKRMVFSFLNVLVTQAAACGKSALQLLKHSDEVSQMVYSAC